MDRSFYLHTLVPIAAGAAITLVPAVAGTLSDLRPSAIELSRKPWCYLNSYVPPLAFLAAQILLIVACGLVSLPGLVIVGAILSGYVLSLGVRGNRAQRLAALFLGAYMAYWIFEKYLLAFGAESWIQLIAPGTELPNIAIAGMSYIGFKLIHFAVDYGSGEIEDVQPLEFLSWLFFFPSIIAGPMQRFQDWQAQRATSGLTVTAASMGIQRLVIGLVMKFVLADTIHLATLSHMPAGSIETAPMLRLIGAAFGYTLYIYWDFAGYSHMAIGIGHFWGIRLPENFNSPFLARNLIEFWKRWHITLSELLRDYLYYPLSLKFKRLRLGRNHPALAAGIPPLITFLIAGIWHGAGINFVLFGLIHGIGLAYLAVTRNKPATAFGRWWLNSRVGHAGAAAINFCYVTFAFVFFSLPVDRLLVLAHRLAF